MQQLEDANDISNDLYDLYTSDALECYLGYGPKLDGIFDSVGEVSDDSDDDFIEIEGSEPK